MKKTATFNLTALRAVALAASTETTRYYLNGVCVEIALRHVNYFATNGHIMVGHRENLLADSDVENTLLGTFIIPIAVCATKGRIFQAKVECSTTDDVEYRLETASPKIFQMIDGTFPDVRRVVPSEISGEIAQFNHAYLATLDKVGAILADTKNKHASVAHNGNGPALVTWPELPLSFGVIMPMCRKARTDVPSWFRGA